MALARATAQVYGSLHKKGNPNIEPKILQSFLDNLIFVGIELPGYDVCCPGWSEFEKQIEQMIL